MENIVEWAKPGESPCDWLRNAMPLPKRDDLHLIWSIRSAFRSLQTSGSFNPLVVHRTPAAAPRITENPSTDQRRSA